MTEVCTTLPTGTTADLCGYGEIPLKPAGKQPAGGHVYRPWEKAIVPSGGDGDFNFIPPVPDLGLPDADGKVS